MTKSWEEKAGGGPSGGGSSPTQTKDRVLSLVFRDGRTRNIKYRNIGDTEYYPASGSRNGYDMEALAFRTTDDKVVVKGYNIAGAQGKIDRGLLADIRETTNHNIGALKREGKPVYVSIELKPLIYEDGPDIPEFLTYFDKMPTAPGLTPMMH